MIEHLFYVSRRRASTSYTDVLRIVFAARIRNRRLDVTGILIEFDDYFAQWLEGAPNVLDSLMHKIQSDARHSDIRIITRGSTDRRLFNDWGMAHVYHPDLLNRISNVHKVASESPRYVESLLQTLVRNCDENYI